MRGGPGTGGSGSTDRRRSSGGSKRGTEGRDIRHASFHQKDSVSFVILPSLFDVFNLVFLLVNGQILYLPNIGNR